MYVRTPDEPEHAEGLSVRMRLTGIPWTAFLPCALTPLTIRVE